MPRFQTATHRDFTPPFTQWAEWKEQGKMDKWKNSTMVNNTNRDFVLYCKRAGIVTSDRLSVQTLRKSYGTNLANLGTPSHTLKELMGHSSITTTMKFYLHVSDENKKKAVRGLDDLISKGANGPNIHVSSLE